MECLGGNGYVEESALPRLYREAPVNSIWEGSGNVQCLDVLRALARDPAARSALVAEIEKAAGSERGARRLCPRAQAGIRRELEFGRVRGASALLGGAFCTRAVG